MIAQFLGRTVFTQQIERLAGDVGVDFPEIVLLDGKENARRRFAERSAALPARRSIGCGAWLERRRRGAILAGSRVRPACIPEIETDGCY
ncbi:hypothetical protein [Candidatus Frankia alpina]|uniref:hypothetical protein n=1 Tax=Candidatus Frankia alpina TaxID=2699483 RepID=UPI001A99F9A6|nr:hypothetical protein [Candidatus Frankia alpina]